MFFIDVLLSEYHNNLNFGEKNDITIYGDKIYKRLVLKAPHCKEYAQTTGENLCQTSNY